MSALVSPTVSDRDALTAVKSLDMPSSQREVLWRQPYRNSAELQRDFLDEGNYSAFMEAVATGRCRIISNKMSAGTSPREIGKASDGRLRTLARNAGWSPEQRIARWASFYNESPHVQAEFMSADNYVAYMEGEFARGR